MVLITSLILMALYPMKSNDNLRQCLWAFRPGGRLRRGPLWGKGRSSLPYRKEKSNRRLLNLLFKFSHEVGPIQTVPYTPIYPEMMGAYILIAAPPLPTY